MSNQFKQTDQYVCECGKAFSGDPKRVKILLRLHYKICECKISGNVILTVTTCPNHNPHSQKKIQQNTFVPTPLGHSAINSLFRKS